MKEMHNQFFHTQYNHVIIKIYRSTWRLYITFFLQLKILICIPENKYLIANENNPIFTGLKHGLCFNLHLIKIRCCIFFSNLPLTAHRILCSHLPTNTPQDNVMMGNSLCQLLCLVDVKIWICSKKRDILIQTFCCQILCTCLLNYCILQSTLLI